MLGDDLEAWMDESTMLRRSFRNVAVIAGLIRARFPARRSRAARSPSAPTYLRPLRKHEPDHILLRATRQDAPGSSPTSGAWAICCAAPRPHRLPPARAHLAARRADPAGDRQERVLDGTAEDELLDIAAQELIDEATRCNASVSS